MTLKAAVIGTGFIGPVHIEALRRLGIEVTGILGHSLENTRGKAARLRLPTAYETLDQLLAEPGLTSVHITTPNHLHAEMVRAALAAGKHVVCEKPLASARSSSSWPSAAFIASGFSQTTCSVSYTHLTLPTKRIV